MALTLSPMLASKFLNKKKSKKIFVQKFDKIFSSFSNFYNDSLEVVVNKAKSVGVFIIFIMITSALLFNFSKKEFFSSSSFDKTLRSIKPTVDAF